MRHQEIVSEAQSEYKRYNDLIVQTKKLPRSEARDANLKKFRRQRRINKLKILCVTDPQKVYGNKFFKKRINKFQWETPITEEFVRRHGVKSFLDIGCALGRCLEGAIEGGATIVKGVDVGYEAMKEHIPPKLAPNITFGDAIEPLDIEGAPFDLVWSMEVAEHIVPERTDAYVKNVCDLSSGLILITVCDEPNRRGSHGHINVQPRPYWIDKFTEAGCTYLEDEVEKTRKIWGPLGSRQYIMRRLMIFRKNRKTRQLLQRKEKSVR
jgi:SAM-dependent methyltransferase